MSRRTRSETTMRGIAVLALVGGAILAGIGFAGSYKALQGLGEAKNFGWFSYVFPIGLDAGILVLLALDLLLIRRRTPWPVLRLLAHTFTVGTVVFNANAGGPIRDDLVGAGMHAVIPLMFIASVEAGRRLVIRITALEDGQHTDGVPLHRWMLAPRRTFALWRRMKLWAVASYREAVDREQKLTVYRVRLEQKFGSVRRAPATERLPLIMAPYGLTIEEALELPRVEAEREKALEDAQKAAEAAAAEREADRVAQAEIAALKRQAEVAAARAEVTASTAVAEAKADAEVKVVAAQAARKEAEERRALAAAEKLAELEQELEETAAMLEAKARAAQAARKEAEDRKAQAAAEAEAAELERQAALARRAAAEADAAAAAEAQAVETQAAAEARRRAAEANEAAAEIERRAAEARRHAAEADRRAAEEKARQEAAVEAAAQAAERAAEARRRAAEIELRAVEMEDAAQLKPSERAARKIARLILAEAGGRADALPLERIVEVLGVSTSTASERRREAAELLASGYRPETVG